MAVETATGTTVAEHSLNAVARDARERGELLWLEPGEIRPYDLEIGALDGAAAIDQFAARIGAIDIGTVSPEAAGSR